MTVESVRVGEVLELQRRGVEIDLMTEYRLVGVYSFGKGLFHREPTLGAELGDYRFFRIEPGDLVLSNIQAWEGAIAYATSVDAGTVGTHRFLSYTARNDRIDTNWARWFFLSEPGMELIRHAAPGTTMRNRTLAIDRFESLEIPLPPIDEQLRIAAHLDRIAFVAAEVARGRDESQNTAHNLAQVRVDDVFGEIKAAVVAIGDVGEVRGGIQRTENRAPAANPVRYLTVAHVGRDSVRFDDPRYFEVTPSELSTRQLHAGDVLIIEGNGSSEQIGRSAIFPGAREVFVHQNHVIRVRPNMSMIESDYLNLFLNSPSGRRAVRAQARTSSGLQSLSVGRIKQILVPVPALEKQRWCVAEVRRRQVDQNRILAAGERLIELNNALVPSALNHAFAGLS